MVFIIGQKSSNQATLPVYFIANQAYQTGRFSEALDGFFSALKDNPNLLQREPLIRFKIGYGLYRTGQYQKAIDVFESGKKPLDFIEDYLYYFQILNYLGLQDTSGALSKIAQIRQKHRESPLLALVDSVRAQIYLEKNLPDSAVKYLKEMMHSGYFDHSGIYLHLFNMFEVKENISQMRRYGFLFLRKYPFHDAALEVYQSVLNSYENKINLKDLEKLFDYLFATNQFLASEELVSRQIEYAKNSYEKDYFNWLPVELAYRQGEYQRVLDWCLAKRSHYKNTAILRKIDFHIPRCYLRLGETDKAIKTYLEYQRRYPGSYISPEVLWKVAWLYEEKLDIPRAISTYEKLVKTYPRSSFSEEAYFRIGLDYFRMGRHAEARNSWQKAVKRTRDRLQRDRVRYWIGKSYEREYNYKKQAEILSRLATRPLDSYYHLKAFYLVNQDKGNNLTINEYLWELHQKNQTHLPDYISDFRRILFVEEILGSKWGDRELRSLKLKSDDWEELFALGELYERMGNYGFAYRRFRNIYDRFFSMKDLPDMIPIFKKLYPLYFTDEVDSAASRFNLQPELILSVIKKESAFEPRIISYANAYGLMQLLPGTASQIAPRLGKRFISADQLFNPSTNIEMGSYYLSTLLSRYQNNYIMALAGYNAGPHRVDRWKKRYSTDDNDLFMENLEFEQTRVYVRACLKYFWIYRAILNPGEIPDEIAQYPVKISDFL